MKTLFKSFILDQFLNFIIEIIVWPTLAWNKMYERASSSCDYVLFLSVQLYVEFILNRGYEI